MNKTRATVAILLCAVPQVVAGALFPAARLTFFAPLITSSYYRLELHRCLWLSVGAGLVVDLLGGTGRLGLLSAVYCLATIILYPQKRHFFPGQLSTIPVLSILFGLATTLISVIIFWPPTVVHGIHMGWIITDIIAMPAADGAYAFLGFVFPMAALFNRRPKVAPYRMSRPK